MILIGATGRNSGKTTLASGLIKALKKEKTVIALKVTTIKERNGKCPRGGEGCGVCSNVQGNYQLIEEKNTVGKKDTALLLKAGADKVYWLKVMQDSMAEGFEAFLNNIPQDAFVICESNSLRHIVKPELFVMIKNTSDTQIKASAKAVIEKADLVIENSLEEQEITAYLEEVLERVKE